MRKSKPKKRFVWEPFQLLNVSAQELSQYPDAADDGPVGEIWINNLYQVIIRRHQSTHQGQCDMIHLSIRSLDRHAQHDWRHFQRIKNELLGPEIEAVEMYPAESRMVDTSNQFHLWAFDDPNFRFPFGYKDRLVTEGSRGRTRQRSFQPGFKPDDCQTLSEL